MVFKLRQTAITDDLQAICEQMQPDRWGPDNEMTSYQPELLENFLARGGILLLAKDGEKIAGAAICHELSHPAGKDTLYVHELDTHPDYRRQGVSTTIMRELIKMAKERGLEEVWVGTETDNDAANAFYRSLQPDEIEPSNVYAYKVVK